MGRPGETEELMWFTMRVTYHRELEAKRLLDEKGVENFIPMKYEKSARTGKKRLVPVIHNIIFVRATASGIQELKQPTRIPMLQYMMDQRLGKKITVPEKQMRTFIAVAGSYDESLRFFRPRRDQFHKSAEGPDNGRIIRRMRRCVCQGQGIPLQESHRRDKGRGLRRVGLRPSRPCRSD